MLVSGSRACPRPFSRKGPVERMGAEREGKAAADGTTKRSRQGVVASALALWCVPVVCVSVVCVCVCMCACVFYVGVLCVRAHYVCA